jgi:hypothetical protein
LTVHGPRVSNYKSYNLGLWLQLQKARRTKTNSLYIYPFGINKPGASDLVTERVLDSKFTAVEARKSLLNLAVRRSIGSLASL